MFCGKRRPVGRLFYWLLAGAMAAGMVVVSGMRGLAAPVPVPIPAAPAPQSGPPTTTVADTIFLADGSFAQGSVVIIWTPFVTASGTPVSGGSKSTTLGSHGALSVALVPNAGATPPGTYYTAVYQLGPGEVRTEYWVVPTTSPANLATVRVAPGAGLAGQAVSLQYVNSQLAAKANDNAVVHVSGTETVSGAKTFTTSPTVPTPANTGDAVSKGYVDSAISNVGGGTFLLTAGGTMTGPITLPGNPASGLQATPKQYVDTGLAAKADLISGLVPAHELGTGTASSGTCLLGNGTWGICGTGSGNVSTAPSASQVIAQPLGTQFAVNDFNNIRYVTGYNWTQSPTADLTATGTKTITLNPCPIGVDTVASDLYAVHIDVQGTPEDDIVTGGTCTSGGASGTIVITTTRTHSAGYTVSSSSQGAQEASNAAAFVPNSATTSQSGMVVFPPGEYTWTSTVYVHQSSQTLDFSGTIIDCKMAATCLYLSTPTLGANGTNNVTVHNFRGRAMIPGGGFPMIEDNANNSRLLHLSTRDAPTCTPFCAFTNLVKIDNDQNFLIDGLDDSAGGWNICNATNGCSTDVLIAGSPFSGTGVIENSNFAGGCGSNYVNDLANNTLSIKNSVMQAWNSYAVQFGGSSGALNPELTMDHVYMEGSNCANYLGLTGNAGILNEGGTLTQRGATGASAFIPYFKNTGSTLFTYYVVVHSSTAGVSLPIFAGKATVDTTAATDIPVTFYQVGSTGTVTYDVLRLSGTGTDGPIGTGNFAIATGQTVAAVCVSSICTVHDTANSTPSSYTVANQSYIPQLTYWPMPIVLTTGTDNAIPSAVGNLFADRVAKGSGIVATDLAVPHIFGAECLGGSFAIPGMTSCTAGDPSGNANPAVQGTIFQSGPVSGGMTSNLKGRVILTQSFLATLAPTDLITVVDSNPVKTSGNTLTRPAADAADSAICSDASSSSNAAQLCLRAPAAISEYINSLPDNTHFLERLTASAKTLNVPLTVNGNLTATGSVKIPVTGTGSQCLHANSTGVLSGTGADCGVGTVNTGAANQIALYSGAGAAVSGDSSLTDSAGTLTYSGSGGIAAAAGNFNGNVTVNGQLLVAGPWTVSSPIPGSPMTAAGAGTSALGISNDGNFYISANAGTPQKVATTATSSFFSNLFQEDGNTLGEYNGTTAQTLNVYGTRTDASNYERLALTYDTTNPSYFKIDAQAAGTGTKRGLAFWVNGAARWAIDQLDVLKPVTDNTYDLGTSSLHVRNGYFGTGVLTPSLTLNGTALSSVIGTPTSALMTAGTVSGTGQPLCTDGTGNLTITTVGCPPGTGTIGGSGAINQFAYWTNTSGLGAAPVFLNGSNTVEQYNSTNAQVFNVYGTRTDASNYERVGLAFVSADGFYELQTQQAGSGSQRGFCFGVNNSCKWAVDTTTAFKPFNDNVRDFGTATARVRDFYLGRNLIMSGTTSSYNAKTTAGTGLTPVYGTVSSTGLTAAVGSTTLCASTTCGAGQYEVSYYVDSTVTCATPGSTAVSLTIGWTDETNAKTLQVPLSGTGVSGGNSIALGNTANFGSGTISLWSAGSANLTYSTAYVACTSGTGTYAVRVAVKQVQ